MEGDLALAVLAWFWGLSEVGDVGWPALEVVFLVGGGLELIFLGPLKVVFCVEGPWELLLTVFGVWEEALLIDVTLVLLLVPGRMDAL